MRFFAHRKPETGECIMCEHSQKAIELNAKLTSALGRVGALEESLAEERKRAAQVREDAALPPFSAGASCVKCGGAAVDGPFWLAEDGWHPEFDRDIPKPHRNRLGWRCKGCRFSWYTRPKDASPS